MYLAPITEIRSLANAIAPLLAKATPRFISTMNNLPGVKCGNDCLAIALRSASPSSVAWLLASTATFVAPFALLAAPLFE